ESVLSQVELGEIEYNKTRINQSFQYLVNFSNTKLREKKYEDALFFSRYAYVKAKTYEEKGNVLFLIANIHESMQNYTKAKIIYRQILKFYPGEENLVKRLKKKLLSL
ncbi:tol-pal system YbgF family protein, partial [bacterium]